MSEISILLGAGFSKNAGYPISNDLNPAIYHLSPEEFVITSERSLFWKEDNEPDVLSGNRTYLKYFITRVIKGFAEDANSFNYELFYDFYTDLLVKGSLVPGWVNDIHEVLVQEYHTGSDMETTIFECQNFLSQIVRHFLVDKDGNQFYRPVHFGAPIYPGYSGVLGCMAAWSQENRLHIHTLNHDLFIEKFGSSDWFPGGISDGFTELGSPYFGKLEKWNHMVRLRYFTNNYEGNVRLYKLHGSVDQFPFRTKESGVETYVKSKFGMPWYFYKEQELAAGGFEYVEDWFSYHPDFLSGTTSKIIRYREPTYYGKLFDHFENNLKISSELYIIGYGGGDKEINRIILELSDKLKIYIVDPFPTEATHELKKELKAKLVTIGLESLSLMDFNE